VAAAAFAFAGVAGEVAGASASVVLEQGVDRILNANVDDHNTLAAAAELVEQEALVGVRVNRNYSFPFAYAYEPEPEPESRLEIDTTVVDAGVGVLHTWAAAAVVETGYIALAVADMPAAAAADVAAAHTPVPSWV
jgi:hypothetical protein